MSERGAKPSPTLRSRILVPGYLGVRPMREVDQKIPEGPWVLSRGRSQALRPGGRRDQDSVTRSEL